MSDEHEDTVDKTKVDKVKEVLADLERHGHVTPHAAQVLHEAVDSPEPKG